MDIFHFKVMMSPMRYDIYGKTIKKLRKQRNYSQEQFIDKTGMVRSQIYYLESGQRLPRLDTLEIICRALDVTLASFFQLAEEIRDQEYEACHAATETTPVSGQRGIRI